MVKCILLKNLSNKNSINCDINIGESTNIKNFIKKMLQYQANDMLFLYKFDNNESYISGKSAEDNDYIIDKFTDSEDDNGLLKIIDHLYDSDYDDKDKKIEYIINSMEKIVKDQNIQEPVDKEKLKEFFNKLTNEHIVKSINNKEKIVQDGGVIFYYLLKWMEPKPGEEPSSGYKGFWWFLEILELIITVISFIPIIGIFSGIIGLIYNILRFDIYNAIISAIQIIPAFGGIPGGIFKIMNQLNKIRMFRKAYTAYKTYKKVRKIVTGIKFASFAARDLARGKLSPKSIDYFVNMLATNKKFAKSEQGHKIQKLLRKSQKYTSAQDIATIGKTAQQLYKQPQEKYYEEPQYQQQDPQYQEQYQQQDPQYQQPDPQYQQQDPQYQQQEQEQYQDSPEYYQQPESPQYVEGASAP